MTACPICSARSRLIWKEKQYSVYRCKKCNTAFLYPLPENTESIYGKTYFGKWYLRYYKKRKYYMDKLLTRIEKHASLRGKLLDIGCGAGILLDAVNGHLKCTTPGHLIVHHFYSSTPA